jgi:hypothetical protein
MIFMKVPYEFAKEMFPLTWTDVLYGLEKNCVSTQFAISHANAELTCDKDADEKVLIIAIASEQDSIIEYAKELAESDGTGHSKQAQEKWLCLTLRWLYENKEKLSDPLAMVEEIYSDFDYPEQMSTFIRYMPSNDTNLGSIRDNNDQMFRRWHDFIMTCGKAFD